VRILSQEEILELYEAIVSARLSESAQRRPRAGRWTASLAEVEDSMRCWSRRDTHGMATR